MYNIVCNPVTTADITMRNNTTGVKRFRSFLILFLLGTQRMGTPIINLPTTWNTDTAIM